MKYLKFHKEWVKKNRIPKPGLCNTLFYDELLGLFNPTTKDKRELAKESKSTGYWGYGGSYESDWFDIKYGYTPLRQTIVLFLAAMNGEL